MVVLSLRYRPAIGERLRVAGARAARGLFPRHARRAAAAGRRDRRRPAAARRKIVRRAGGAAPARTAFARAQAPRVRRRARRSRVAAVAGARSVGRARRVLGAPGADQRAARRGHRARGNRHAVRRGVAEAALQSRTARNHDGQHAAGRLRGERGDAPGGLESALPRSVRVSAGIRVRRQAGGRADPLQRAAADGAAPAIRRRRCASASRTCAPVPRTPRSGAAPMGA